MFSFAKFARLCNAGRTAGDQERNPIDLTDQERLLEREKTWC